jgi:hypothetical protein
MQLTGETLKMNIENIDNTEQSSEVSGGVRIESIQQLERVYKT